VYFFSQPFENQPMIARTVQLYRKSFSGLSREVWLLSLVMLINRSGTMVLPFLSIYLTRELGFTFGQAGYIMSMFGAGSVIGSFLGGRLTDRIGYYPVQFWSLLLGGGMFFVLMFMQSFWTIGLTIFVASIILDAFRPASMTAVGAYSKPKNLTRSISLIRLAINLGFSVGPLVGGILAISLGYQWLFILDGLTCIGAAFMFRAMLNERKVRKPQGEETEEPSPKTVPVRSPYRDRLYWGFMVVVLLTATTFMQLFNTLPVYLKDIVLLNEDQIGLLMGLNGLLIAITEMPLIYALENRVARLRLIRWGALLIGAAFVVFNVLGSWLVVAIISILFITIGEMINFPFANSFAVDRSTPRNRGQYMGMFTMTFSVAHVLAPTLGMQTAQVFGFDVLWYLVGGFTVLAAALLWLLERALQREHTGQLVPMVE
jgi:predicted MFS family arabinose efflux permease